MTLCNFQCPANCNAYLRLRNLYKLMKVDDPQNIKVAVLTRMSTDGPRKVLVPRKRLLNSNNEEPTTKKICASNKQSQGSEKKRNPSPQKKNQSRTTDPDYEPSSSTSSTNASPVNDENSSKRITARESTTDISASKENTILNNNPLVEDDDSEPEILFIQQKKNATPSTSPMKQTTLNGYVINKTPNKMPQKTVIVPKVKQLPQSSVDKRGEPITTNKQTGIVATKPTLATQIREGSPIDIERILNNGPNTASSSALPSVDDLVNQLPSLDRYIKSNKVSASEIVEKFKKIVPKLNGNNDKLPWHLLEQAEYKVYDVRVSTADSTGRIISKKNYVYYSIGNIYIPRVEVAYKTFFRLEKMLYLSKKPSTFKIRTLLIQMYNGIIRILVVHYGKPTRKGIKLLIWENTNETSESEELTLPGVDAEEEIIHDMKKPDAGLYMLLPKVKVDESLTCTLPPILISTTEKKVAKISLEKNDGGNNSDNKKKLEEVCLD